MSTKGLINLLLIVCLAAVIVPAGAQTVSNEVPLPPSVSSRSLAAQAPSADGLPAIAAAKNEYALGAGDVIRINVFQNPDLTTEARVSENGAITFPLLGSVTIGGMIISAAEQRIAQQLKDGGFVLQPQVSINLLQVRGNQVAVLGQVNRPGRYPLETARVRLSDMLATAGGISASGGDLVVVTGTRDGKPFRYEINVPSMFLKSQPDLDMIMQDGDAIFVDRAPMFYIYGEVQKPGVFRLDRDMNLMQALAAGGGLTNRGTLRGVQLHRRDSNGRVQIYEPKMTDRLQADDIVYVKESLF